MGDLPVTAVREDEAAGEPGRRLPAGTPTDERPDVFLSYSRTDQQVVLRLASALERAGWRVWVDAEDIPPAAEWREELTAGIQAAHTFVFAVSPDSVVSDYCLWELEQAAALGKRLVPLVIRPVEEAPEALASRQYVFMREEDDFDEALETLTGALRTDLEWVRAHRQWLIAALRWDTQNRDRSLLLRGRDLKAAEVWLARQAERSEPRPTQLQSEFLIASRAWETRRTQIIAGAVAVALAVAIALGVLALLQRNDARDQAAVARSRELALSAMSQLSIDPERSLLLAREAVAARPTAEADNALRRAVFASRVSVAVPLRATRIGGLINAVAFSPDGKYVAGALKNGTVAVVNSTARPGARATVLPLAPRSPEDACSVFVAAAGHVAVTFSRGSRLVAAVNEKAWIHVWRWPARDKPVTSPFCFGRTTAPNSSDVVFETLTRGSAAPAALAFAGPRVVAVVEGDGQVLRWRWASRARPVLQGRTRRPILAAAFASAARRTVLAERDGITLLAPAERRSLSLPVGGVTTLAVSADGRTVAGAGGRRIVVWKPGLAASPVSLRAPTVIRAIATSRNGDVVAVGDNGHAIRVWDLSRGGRPVVLRGSEGAVTAVAFSADGRRIVSGGDDGVLRVWNWDPSRSPRLPGPARRSTRFELTLDGRLLALDPQNPNAAWLASGGRLRRLEGLLRPASVAVSRDARRAVAPVAPVSSGTVQLWELDRSPRPRVTAVAGRVNDVALSPDGRWIAFAGRRFHLAAWPGKEPRSLGLPRFGQYTAVAFAPDSRSVAAAAYDGKRTTIFVWGVPAGDASGASPAVTRTFTALGGSNSLAFSSDGERLVAAQSDGGVRIWELDGGSAPDVLRGHTDDVNGAAFSPDGTEVVTGGADGTVRVWRLDQGAKSVAIPGPRDLVAVAFTRDGRGVIAVGTRSSHVWRCDFCGATSDVVAAAERLATRTLSADERRLFLHER